MPYHADHEHPSKTSTRERADLVFRKVMTVEAHRIAQVTRFLESRGLKIGSAPGEWPEDWDAIGEWLETHIEGSREPGSGRYPPYVADHDGPKPSAIRGESTTELRPVLNSLAFDLSLLLGHHMIRCGRPGGRWTRFAPDGVSALPEVMFTDYSGFYSPFADMDIFLHAKLLARLGLARSDRLLLGDMLRRVQEGPPRQSEATDPEVGFAEHLQRAEGNDGAGKRS